MDVSSACNWDTITVDILWNISHKSAYRNKLHRYKYNTKWHRFRFAIIIYYRFRVNFTFESQTHTRILVYSKDLNAYSNMYFNAKNIQYKLNFYLFKEKNIFYIAFTYVCVSKYFNIKRLYFNFFQEIDVGSREASIVAAELKRF